MSAGPERLFDPQQFDLDSDSLQDRDGRQDRRGPEPGERIVRVLPDLSGLEREFDYLCPARWADDIAVGSLVRVDLNRRRIAGWVTAIDVTPADVDPDALATLTKVSSIGPPAEIVDLARWTAQRWHGRLAPVLKAASPPRMVSTRPEPRTTQVPRPAVAVSAGSGGSRPGAWLVDAAAEARTASGTTCFESSPSDDVIPLLHAVSGDGGGCLVVVPDVRRSRRLAGALRRLGVRVHLHPNQWSGGFSGGLVIGSRSSVWAPVHDLRTIVVIDEHDESLQTERVPTWNARDVAVERARRLGIRCLLVSATPSLAARHLSDRVIRAPRATQRRGWPITEVVDRRQDELGFSNLFSPRLVDLLRSASSAVLVLNRKGRARLLACRSCGELVRTEDGHHLMIEDEGGLVAPSTGERRPLVCAHCGGTGLNRLRLGIGKAGEELSRLLGRPVTELSSSGSGSDGVTTSDRAGRNDVILGTEAALHAVDRCELVGFLDFDQELLAPRYRAGEQALALIGLAGRLVGGRDDGGRIVIQTRVPDHRVNRAAVAADPSRFAQEEAALRSEIGFPPYGALAELSGAGSDEYAAALASAIDGEGGRWSTVRLLGPRRDNRYLLSITARPGSDAEGSDQDNRDPNDVLAELLAAVPRPRKRVRVAVDPPRV